MRNILKAIGMLGSDKLMECFSLSKTSHNLEIRSLCIGDPVSDLGP